AALAIADGYIRVRGDVAGATQWLENIEQPQPLTRLALGTHPDGGFAAYWRRFALNRALAAVGEDVPAAALVPDAKDAQDELAVRFERAVIVLAQLAGTALRGPIAPGAFQERVRPLIRLFRRSPEAE